MLDVSGNIGNVRSRRLMPIRLLILQLLLRWAMADRRWDECQGAGINVVYQ